MKFSVEIVSASLADVVYYVVPVFHDVVDLVLGVVNLRHVSHLHLVVLWLCLDEQSFIGCLNQTVDVCRCYLVS
jgi:hypothetical protein